MGRIRHSLSSKLGVSILLLSILVFVASLGVMFVQSRLMLRKKATERTPNGLSVCWIIRCSVSGPV